MSKETHCTPCHPHPHPCPPSPTCIKQDFILSDGVKVCIDKPGQEVKHNFTLHPNPFKDFGTISGVVKDLVGHPIHNALVKVFDEHHCPFAHVFTNCEGQFLIAVPPGRYILKAVR